MASSWRIFIICLRFAQLEIWIYFSDGAPFFALVTTVMDTSPVLWVHSANQWAWLSDVGGSSFLSRMVFSCLFFRSTGWGRCGNHWLLYKMSSADKFVVNDCFLEFSIYNHWQSVFKIGLEIKWTWSIFLEVLGNFCVQCLVNMYTLYCIVVALKLFSWTSILYNNFPLNVRGTSMRKMCLCIWTGKDTSSKNTEHLAK